MKQRKIAVVVNIVLPIGEAGIEDETNNPILNYF